MKITRDLLAHRDYKILERHNENIRNMREWHAVSKWHFIESNSWGKCLELAQPPLEKTIGERLHTWHLITQVKGGYMKADKHINQPTVFGHKFWHSAWVVVVMVVVVTQPPDGGTKGHKKKKWVVFSGKPSTIKTQLLNMLDCCIFSCHQIHSNTLCVQNQKWFSFLLFFLRRLVRQVWTSIMYLIKQNFYVHTTCRIQWVCDKSNMLTMSPSSQALYSHRCSRV